MINHIRTHCFSSVYGTSLSPPAATQIIAALEAMQSKEGTRRLHQLRENSILFHRGLAEIGCAMVGPEGVPVVPIFLFHPYKISGFSRECFKHNLAVGTA